MANLATLPESSLEEDMSASVASSSESSDLRNEKVLLQVQERLKKQLLDKKHEIEDRIYEQKRYLLRATKDREEAGVQLYDLQCNLASLHASLTKTTVALDTASQGHAKQQFNVCCFRSMAREELDTMEKQHALRSKEHKVIVDKTAETRRELDNITNVLMSLEDLSEKLKGDIALNRRATYATEEATLRIESLKKLQDAAIDDCQTRIQEILNKVELTKGQLEAQKRESFFANLALKEADIEMASIHAEKRQLTFQWKTTLIALTRCDNAVKLLRDAIDKQAEVKVGIKIEKSRYVKDTGKMNNLCDRAKFRLLKIDSSMKEVAKFINNVTNQCTKVNQQYAKVLIKVEKVKNEIKVAVEDIKKLKLTIKTKIMSKLLEQVILEEKGAEAKVANISELRKLVKKQDSMATKLNHELSSIRCEVLAVQAYNQEINIALKMVNDDVAAKYNIIFKFDAEIKQKDREVDLKTKEIMRLNKKYEQLTANMSHPDASSPWEAMIYNLRIEINQNLKESNESQRQWLSLQTSLVGLQNDINTLSEQVQRAIYDQGILIQRKYRVDAQCNIQIQSSKDLQVEIGQKRNLIARLNDLIGKNNTLETSLVDVTKNMQTQHVVILKDLAKETMDLESQFHDLVVEKDHALKHLDELEHHVMLWRYKISYEIQIQVKSGYELNK
uniref:Coiled-coil domain-containing protein 40 n=2 Tax=Physcomitrium patens TaxID=3218 RepID=A0A7I4FFZ0_PHYPA